MSFKDKPLKKIVADKRVTIDAIHNNIINDFKIKRENYDEMNDRLKKLEYEFSIKPSDGLSNMIYKLKSDINKYDKSDEINYYLDTSDILDEYYSNKNNINEDSVSVIDIMKLNNNDKKKKTINDKYTSVIDPYMNVINDIYINDNLINVNDKCSECQTCLKIIKLDSLLICPNCGLINEIIINNDKISFKDTNRETTYFAYKRINHFNEWLAQFQAKETTDIPKEIFDKIFYELKKLKITDYSTINYKLIRSILKKINYNKYYEHIPHIINIINGHKAPLLNRRQEEQLRMMFKEIQTPFMKNCPDGRKNFLSYSYVLHKFCELIELDHLLTYFPLLKSREKLQQQDKIWEKICRDLKWQYIPSI